VTWLLGRSWSSIVGLVTCCRLDGLGANLGKDRKCPDLLWGLRSLLFSGYQCFFLGVHGQGMKLTTHIHLLPRLRMSGAVPLIPIYAFVAWTGKILHFCVNLDELKMDCQISKKNVSFHKLTALSYECLICQNVVGICQDYNVTHDRNCTIRNVSCL